MCVTIEPLLMTLEPPKKRTVLTIEQKLKVISQGKLHMLLSLKILVLGDQQFLRLNRIKHKLGDFPNNWWI